jgi:hypothetical protein
MKRRYAAIAAGSVVSLSLLFLVGWRSAVGTQTEAKGLPQVKYDAESFRVISEDIQPLQELQMLILKLRNTSSKTIVYFKMGSCAGRTFMDMDATISGEGDGIASGGIFIVRVPLEQLYRDCSAVGQPPTVTIQSVIFDDHTSEGDWKTAEIIRDEQLGQKAQFIRIKHFIGDSLNATASHSLKSGDDERLAAFDSIEAGVLSLPDKEDGRTPAYNFGLRNAKRMTLERIKELGEWERRGHKPYLRASLSGARDLREGLTKVLDELKRKISNY